MQQSYKNKFREMFYSGIIPIIFIVLILGCSTSNKEKCIIGQKYIRKLMVNEDNPFEIAIYDTVVVLDVKKGWVKYTNYKNTDTSYFYSGREEFFLEDSKPISN
jgi:hypothetical protein